MKPIALRTFWHNPSKLLLTITIFAHISQHETKILDFLAGATFKLGLVCVPFPLQCLLGLVAQTPHQAIDCAQFVQCPGCQQGCKFHVFRSLRIIVQRIRKFLAEYFVGVLEEVLVTTKDIWLSRLHVIE